MVTLKDRLQDTQKLFIQQVGKSSTGMTRWYNVFIIPKKERIENISWLIGKDAGLGWNEKRHAVKVGGYGFSGEHHILGFVKQHTGIENLSYEKF